MLCGLLLTCAGQAFAHKAHPDARIFFILPLDGTVTESPVRFEFGSERISIAAAGVNKHRAGHYHLLINVDDPQDLDTPIPFDARHLHFSNGETEVELHLNPGSHRLQLVLGDEEHLPWAEWLYSAPITVEVVE